MSTVTDDSLASARFSDELRAGTSAEHRDAEGSAFARALLRGELDRDAYASLVSQLHFVYSVLEEAGDAMAGDAVAGPFVFDELRRGAALATDLRFLLGPAWRDAIRPLPATTAYCERLREVCFTWPGGFVAHHYTRYMGDLSGGQAIRRVVERTFDWNEGDGVQFYLFPAISDARSFKAGYRERLDSARWDRDERTRIIEESSLAFRHNGALLHDLATVAG